MRFQLRTTFSNRWALVVLGFSGHQTSFVWSLALQSLGILSRLVVLWVPKYFGIIIFFCGFSWRWRSFRRGWADPAEEVGLKNINSWRGLAGRTPHLQNMLRDSPSVRRIFGALCLQLFVGSQKNILCPYN